MKRQCHPKYFFTILLSTHLVNSNPLSIHWDTLGMHFYASKKYGNRVFEIFCCKFQ